MKNKYIFIICLSIMFLFISQTIAYCALSATMNISGSSIARIETDVRINNIYMNKEFNTTGVSFYEMFSKDSLSIGFVLDGNAPIYYDIEIGNYTDILVGIQNITGFPEGLEYSFIDYSTKDVLIDGVGSRILTICFDGTAGSYNININFKFNEMFKVDFVGFNLDLSSVVFKGNFFGANFGMEDVDNVFVTSDNSTYTDFTLRDNSFSIGPVDRNLTVTKNDTFINVKNGNIYKMNSEVCIGEECFYVVNSDDTSFRLFAKYNLYVGADWNGSKMTSYGDEATGIQHPDMRAYIGDGIVRKGVVRFVDDEWWLDTITEYPAYVYDSRSNFYEYIENYRDYLESIGAVINDARLISYEEMVELGCNPGLELCVGYSEEWVYYTSFWTGSAANNNSTKNMWAVFSYGGKFFVNTATNVNGVRPLIEIKYSDL